MTLDPIAAPVSRRDFARQVAMVAAISTLVLPEVASAQSDSNAPAPVPPLDVPKEVATEVEIKFNSILRMSVPGAAGSFTPDQKDEIRRQLVSQVQGLQKLRAYALDNGEAPATVLHLASAASGEGK